VIKASFQKIYFLKEAFEMKRCTAFLAAVLLAIAFVSAASAASKLSDAEYKRMLKACPEFAAADKRMNAAWKALGQAADAERMKKYKLWQANWSDGTRQNLVAGMVASKNKDLIPSAAMKGGKVDRDLAFAVVTDERARWIEELARREEDPAYLSEFTGRLYWGRNPAGGYLAFVPDGWWTELVLCYGWVDLPFVEGLKKALDNSPDAVVSGVVVKGWLTSELGFEWYEDTPAVTRMTAEIIQKETIEIKHSLKPDGDAFTFTLDTYAKDDEYYTKTITVKDAGGKSLQTIATADFNDGEDARTIFEEPDERLTFVDLNFDGWDDMMIVQSIPAGPYTSYIVWLWDAAKKQFVHEKTLSGLSEIEADAETETIKTSYYYTTSKWGEEFYKYTDGKLTLFKSVETNVLTENGEPVFEDVTSELKDGKMVETSRVKRKDEEEGN
jgi:hypothetical protein